MATWHSFFSFPSILNSFSSFVVFTQIYSSECCCDDGTIWLWPTCDTTWKSSLPLPFFSLKGMVQMTYSHFFLYNLLLNSVYLFNEVFFFNHVNTYIFVNTYFLFSSQVLHTNLRKKLFLFSSAFISCSFPLPT